MGFDGLLYVGGIGTVLSFIILLLCVRARAEFDYTKIYNKKTDRPEELKEK